MAEIGTDWIIFVHFVQTKYLVTNVATFFLASLSQMLNFHRVLSRLELELDFWYNFRVDSRFFLDQITSLGHLDRKQLGLLKKEFLIP